MRVRDKAIHVSIWACWILGAGAGIWLFTGAIDRLTPGEGLLNLGLLGSWIVVTYICLMLFLTTALVASIADILRSIKSSLRKSGFNDVNPVVRTG